MVCKVGGYFAGGGSVVLSLREVASGRVGRLVQIFVNVIVKIQREREREREREGVGIFVNILKRLLHFAYCVLLYSSLRILWKFRFLFFNSRDDVRVRFVYYLDTVKITRFVLSCRSRNSL